MEITLFVIAVGLVGLYMAWNIGSNDVANAMGTSVGSKALTVRNAVIVAAVLTLLGAVLVGSHVTKTVVEGIVDTGAFADEPKVFMYGAFAALLAAGMCVNLATHFHLPVSTTHAVVGAMAGFGLITRGISAINLGTLFKIALSWVISPVSGAILAFLIFTWIKRSVLDSTKPFESAKKILPYMVSMVFFVLVLSLIYKGLKNLGLDIPLIEAIGIAALTGIFAGLITYLLLRGYSPTNEDHYVPVEKLFGYLQILSACYVAFAHGANDVANAIGPVAAVLYVVQNNAVPTGEGVTVPLGLLLLGGIGIAVGCWGGQKVMRTIGERITEVTPTRGFSAEFGAATTVLICSKMGLPISTTHVLVGSVIGVGFARGMAALNMGVIKNILVSWILTIPLAATLTTVIYLGIGFIL
jgi:PiT family inorganic phosphate transporter